MFNNSFHKHIRSGCKISKVEAYPTTSASFTSSIKGTEASSSTVPEPFQDAGVIIPSKENPNFDVDSVYGFRGWQYATADVNLSKTGERAPICLDTGAGVTLADITFFKRQSQE